MRSRSVLLAVPLLLGPGVLACFSAGYFDTARLRAGVLAWLLLAVAAAVLPQPLPRSGPGRIALAGLAALTALTGLSLLWAPLAGPASDDLQRQLVYLPALAAGIAVLRAPAAARLTEPLLLLGIAGATLYGLSERLLEGLVELEPILSAGDRLAYPLTYWNGTGAFAALGLILAAGIAGDEARPRALRVAAAAAGPLLALAIYLTFSRGALGALAAGLGLLVVLRPTAAQLRAPVVMAATGALAAVATLALPGVTEAGGGSTGDGLAMLALLTALSAAAGALAPSAGARSGATGGARPDPSRALPHLRSVALAVLALVLVATVAAVLQTERDGGRDAPEATASRLASVQSNRYEYWRVAVRAFAEHPAAGEGAGAFRTVWLRERPFRESVRDAHSLYLETAAELGLAGLACLALLFGGVAAAARRTGPAAATPIAALAAFALHAGLDWDWELPALTLVAIVLAARLLAAAEPPAAAPRAA